MAGQSDAEVRSCTMKKMLSYVLAVFAAVLCLNGCSSRNAVRVNGIRLEEIPRQLEETASDTAGQTDRPDDEAAVYVCGAVMKPGVCYLSSDARVCDAIEAAGGFVGDADTEWLNLARHINDAEMIVVYTREETASLKESGSGADLQESGGPEGGLQASETGSDRVNLNSASKEQLMTLPGIGEAKASSIIRYREENGPFSCPEDVMNISGIKNSVYEKIRDLITV